MDAEALTQWVTSVVETLGYLGVGLLVALESVFPPIPSEVVLPLAGFATVSGGASLPGMILAATLGSLVGAVVLYGVAAALGPDRLRRLVDRYGKWARVDVADIERSEAWFDRRAGRMVLFGRCVPLVRSLISIPAGFRRMAPTRFLAYTAIGSLIWNVALIGAGRVLGSSWQRMERPLDLARNVVIILLLGALAWFVWRRFIAPRRRGD